MEKQNRIIESLEGFLRRLIKFDQYAEKWILRGSLVMRQWCPHRSVKDIDFYILQDSTIFEESDIRKDIETILSVDTNDHLRFEIVNYDVTWFSEINGGHKGARVHMSVINLIDKWSEIIIMDLGLDDPLSDDNPWISYVTLGGDILSIRSSSPTVALAWKLQLLLQGNWRAKDVTDIYVLTDIIKQQSFDWNLLWQTIIRIFKFRNQPLDRFKMLFELKLGHSRTAKRKWRKFQEDYPIEWVSLFPSTAAETFTVVADRLSVHLLPLLSSDSVIEQLHDLVTSSSG